MTPMTPKKRWTPSTDHTHDYTRYREALETQRELHETVREKATADLKAGATVTQLARLTGMTPEVFRRIARAEHIERKREPTVGKDAKPKTNEPSHDNTPQSRYPAYIKNLDPDLVDQLVELVHKRAPERKAAFDYEAMTAPAGHAGHAVISMAIKTSVLNQTDLHV